MLRSQAFRGSEANVRSTPLAASLLFLACLFGTASADEGMWMPQQIPALADRLSALGFEGDARAFADLTGQPMGAIVSLGGCSASFVSPDGLIVTNHHCVQGALQYNSTPERNLLVDGFSRRRAEEELSNGPGSRVSVTTQVVEVTDDLARKLTGNLTDRERFDAVERWTKERIAACEKDGSRCRVASFFGGLQWFEIKQLEIQDVRLVYAPAKGIGNFGGETDNWRWPRHTGDFSFYRAYVGPDGEAGDLLEGQRAVPAEALAQGVAEGREPRRTRLRRRLPGRHPAAPDLRRDRETHRSGSSRDRSADRRSSSRSSTSWREPSPELAIKLETRIRGLNNGLTKNRGVAKGSTEGGALEKKSEQQQSLTAWIGANPERRMLYGDVLVALAALDADAAKTRERDAIFAGLRGGRGGARSWARRPRSSTRPPTGRRRTSTASPSTRSGTGPAPAKASSACKRPSTARWTGRSCGISSSRHHASARASASSRSIAPPACPRAWPPRPP